MSTKLTMATVKSFIRKNRTHLLIRYKSSFDGMTDSTQYVSRPTFHRVKDGPGKHSNEMGVPGAWFVGGSRDSISALSDPGLTGFHIYNCCGSFDIAIEQP